MGGEDSGTDMTSGLSKYAESSDYDWSGDGSGGSGSGELRFNSIPAEFLSDGSDDGGGAFPGQLPQELSVSSWSDDDPGSGDDMADDASQLQVNGSYSFWTGNQDVSDAHSLCITQARNDAVPLIDLAEDTVASDNEFMASSSGSWW